MLYFPDPDTGYCDDERSYYDHDRELELAELQREVRFEVEAEEMLSGLWVGPIVPYVDASPVSRSFAAPEGIDSETGCTPAEMKEEEIDRVPVGRTIEERADAVSCEGRVA